MALVTLFTIVHSAFPMTFMAKVRYVTLSQFKMVKPVSTLIGNLGLDEGNAIWLREEMGAGVHRRPRCQGMGR